MRGPSPEAITEAILLYVEKGYSLARVKEETGVATSTLYGQLKRRGIPRRKPGCPPGFVHEPALDRFYRCVPERPADGCWEWRGSVVDGYGWFHHEGAMRPAHRGAYKLLVGPLSEGYDIHHLCRNRGCVNPEHLRAISHADHARLHLLERAA